MTHIRPFSHYRLYVPVFLILCTIFIARSELFMVHPDIFSFAITFDLLLSVPLVYLLFTIKRSVIPKITTVPIIAIGATIAYYILPEDYQYYLHAYKNWVAPVLELFVIAYLIFNVRIGIRKYQSNLAKGADFFSVLKETCCKIFPSKLVYPIATEVAVLYYTFFSWKRRKLKENEFTCYLRSGIVITLTAMLFVIVIETAGLHLLLIHFSKVIAWVFTGLSIYTTMQVIGFIRSLSRRPAMVTESKLLLRYGIWAEAEIDLADIEKVEFTNSRLKQLDDFTVYLSPFGKIESYNAIIHLTKANTLISIYGFTKKYKSILLNVDDKEKFKSALSTYVK